MDNQTICSFLIENDIGYKPAGERITAYVNAIKTKDKSFSYNSVRDIINKASEKEYYQTVFDKLFYPLANENEEIIPRKNWDFSNLTGNDKKFLKNEVFEFSNACMMHNYVKTHDVLIVIEPFRKKPYIANRAYEFIKEFKERVDICVMSEIGIVPLYPNDYSNLYPYRYFRYVKKKDAKSPLKYNTKQLKKFIETFDYKYILFIGTHQSYNPFMHDLYFNISMECNVNTDWVWSLNEPLWYKLAVKYGSTVCISYPANADFKDLVRRKVDSAFRFTKLYS